MVSLNNNQINIILEKFNEEASQAHQNIWKKRQYAPMNIFKPEFENVLKYINEKYSDYTILFDVVFESNGNKTDWHCDYESLGPFIINNSFESIKETHFASIHFNITENGGSLVTLPWLYTSYFYHSVIVYFGIFSVFHKLLNFLMTYVFKIYGNVYPNTRGLGNFFDNMRLHSVNEGSPRISYVVRLAKNNSVTISKKSIQEGVKRSDACLAFVPLLNVVGNTPVFASDVLWHNMESI